jgi:glucose/arabinose dehydrogenase/type 1 glutamine amidotransferase
MRSRHCQSFALLLVTLCACGSTDSKSPESPPSSGAIRALVFTRADGAAHASSEARRAFFENEPANEGIEFTLTDDAGLFSDSGLRAFDVVVFANTTGNVLNASQQAAFERFIANGNGFVGIHSAAETERDWGFYRDLVGASATNEALPEAASIRVEDPTHPSAGEFQSEFAFSDGFYEFDRNPRETRSVVLSSDIGGGDRPLAWYQYVGGGRSFYTSLGHASETWSDARFRSHVLGGLRWAARGGGFGRAVLTRSLRSPIALAVRPDEDVYVIERTGEVRLVRASSGKVDTALTLQVDTAQENGLLGLALDPHFSENPYVYLYYSAPLASDAPTEGPPGRNLLVRLSARADGTLDPESALVLLEVPSERRCCHEGGSLTFASDGTLWLSTGDNTNPFDSEGTAPIDRRPARETFNAERTAANPFDLRGKLLRINPDGSIPDGNLFPRSGEAGRPEVYALGVRNPYRLAADPITPRVFFSDVGPDAASDSARGPRGYDEVNLAQPGNYGWPHCIGQKLPYPAFDFETREIGAPFDCDDTVAPLLAYDYGTETYPALGVGILPDGTFVGRAAIAGAVYRAPLGARRPWPARFDGRLVIADWTRNIIASASIDDAGKLLDMERLLPGESFRRPIDFEVGPDGSLYVLEYGSDFWGNNPDAQLSRIEYAEFGQLAPIARMKVSSFNGPAGSVIHFSAEDSRVLSPQERIADYAWDFDGDGAPDAHGMKVDHRFATSGGYAVSLRVLSSSGVESRPVAESIVIGNTPPQVRILSPGRGTRLARGVEVLLRGEGSDAEDGNAKCDELVWNVSLVHNTHAHPVATLSGCEARFVPDVAGHESEGLLAYVVELVYTDHGGSAGEPALSAREGIQYDVDVR